jgi:hypothetical protein
MQREGGNFKPIIGNERVYMRSVMIRRVRVVNFAIFKNLIVKSTTFPHCNIHKHTWTSPNGVTHTQMDHVLIDKRQHSNILYVHSSRGADCDTDHYMVVSKLRERISVSKCARQKFDLERFYLRKLNDTEVKEEYYVEISNRFASSGNLDESLDVSGACKSITIRYSIKSSAKKI